jgi:hypothetical protein
MAFPGFIQGVVSFADATTYDEFTLDPLQTTTSDGWVEAAKYTVPEEREAGIFNVQWSMKVEQSKGGRSFGVQISYRLGDDSNANPWTVIDSINSLQVSSDNAAFLHSGFRNINITSSGLFQIRIEYGQTTAGGAAGLSEIELVTFRVGELP